MKGTKDKALLALFEDVKKMISSGCNLYVIGLPHGSEGAVFQVIYKTLSLLIHKGRLHSGSLPSALRRRVLSNIKVREGNIKLMLECIPYRPSPYRASELSDPEWILSTLRIVNNKFCIYQLLYGRNMEWLHALEGCVNSKDHGILV